MYFNKQPVAQNWSVKISYGSFLRENNELMILAKNRSYFKMKASADKIEYDTAGVGNKYIKIYSS